MAGGRPFVMDIGSGQSKTGFADNQSPLLIYQSCVQQHEQLNASGIRQKPHGYEIGNKGATYGALNFPIEHGIVRDWNDIEKIWHHAFNNFGINPKDHPILITEVPLNPMVNREKIAEIMFEKYQVPALYFGNTAKMCASSLAISTCLILELGDGVISAVPVSKGEILPGCTKRNDFGGRELTKYFWNLLDGNGLNRWDGFSCKDRFVRKCAIRDVVRIAKEKMCYVSRKFQEENGADMGVESCLVPMLKDFKNYDIKVGKERFQCPEALFDPTLIGLSAMGIHRLTVAAIEKCDRSLWSELYKNIVLCGGMNQLPGLAIRLNIEIFKLLSKCYRRDKTYATDIKGVSMSTAPDLACAWMGAAKIACSTVFRELCTDRAKYEELGNAYLHRMAEYNIDLESYHFV